MEMERVRADGLNSSGVSAPSIARAPGSPATPSTLTYLATQLCEKCHASRKPFHPRWIVCIVCKTTVIHSRCAPRGQNSVDNPNWSCESCLRPRPRTSSQQQNTLRTSPSSYLPRAPVVSSPQVTALRDEQTPTLVSPDPSPEAVSSDQASEAEASLGTRAPTSHNGKSFDEVFYAVPKPASRSFLLTWADIAPGRRRRNLKLTLTNDLLIVNAITNYEVLLWGDLAAFEQDGDARFWPSACLRLRRDGHEPVTLCFAAGVVPQDVVCSFKKHIARFPVSTPRKQANVTSEESVDQTNSPKIARIMTKKRSTTWDDFQELSDLEAGTSDTGQAMGAEQFRQLAARPVIGHAQPADSPSKVPNDSQSTGTSSQPYRVVSVQSKELSPPESRAGSIERGPSLQPSETFAGLPMKRRQSGNLSTAPNAGKRPRVEQPIVNAGHAKTAKVNGNPVVMIDENEDEDDDIATLRASQQTSSNFTSAVPRRLENNTLSAECAAPSPDEHAVGLMLGNQGVSSRRDLAIERAFTRQPSPTSGAQNSGRISEPRGMNIAQVGLTQDKHESSCQVSSQIGGVENQDHREKPPLAPSDDTSTRLADLTLGHRGPDSLATHQHRAGSAHSPQGNRFPERSGNPEQPVPTSQVSQITSSRQTHKHFLGKQAESKLLWDEWRRKARDEPWPSRTHLPKDAQQNTNELEKHSVQDTPDDAGPEAMTDVSARSGLPISDALGVRMHSSSNSMSDMPPPQVRGPAPGRKSSIPGSDFRGAISNRSSSLTPSRRSSPSSLRASMTSTTMNDGLAHGVIKKLREDLSRANKAAEHFKQTTRQVESEKEGLQAKLDHIAKQTRHNMSRKSIATPHLGTDQFEEETRKHVRDLTEITQLLEERDARIAAFRLSEELLQSEMNRLDTELRQVRDNLVDAPAAGLQERLQKAQEDTHRLTVKISDLEKLLRNQVTVFHRKSRDSSTQTSTMDDKMLMAQLKPLDERSIRNPAETPIAQRRTRYVGRSEDQEPDSDWTIETLAWKTDLAPAGPRHRPLIRKLPDQVFNAMRALADQGSAKIPVTKRKRKRESVPGNDDKVFIQVKDKVKPRNSKHIEIQIRPPPFNRLEKNAQHSRPVIYDSESKSDQEHGSIPDDSDNSESIDSDPPNQRHHTIPSPSRAPPRPLPVNHSTLAQLSDDDDEYGSSIEVGGSIPALQPPLPPPCRPTPTSRPETRDGNTGRPSSSNGPLLTNTESLCRFNASAGVPDKPTWPVLHGAQHRLAFKEEERVSRAGRRQKDKTKPAYLVRDT